MPLCGVDGMKYLWFLNGAFQSVLWSSLIQTISQNLAEDKLPKAILVMSTPVASGTFAAYGLAALFSALRVRWTLIFYVASALVGIAAVLWFFGIGALEQGRERSAPTSRITLRNFSLTPTLALFAGIACLMAAVNNVITSVVPLYSGDRIDSGLCAGLLNAFCYAGTTLSTPLLGKIADTSGWNPLFGCLLVFAAVAFVACIVSAFFVTRKKH